MPTQKPVVSVVLDEKILEKIDDFTFGNRIRSRSFTIGNLVLAGLSLYESEGTECVTLATDKPRIVVTVEEETLDAIKKYQYEKKISTLSKAGNEIIQSFLKKQVVTPNETDHDSSFMVRAYKNQDDWTEFYFDELEEVFSFLKMCAKSGLKVEVIQLK